MVRARLLELVRLEVLLVTEERQVIEDLVMMAEPLELRVSVREPEMVLQAVLLQSVVLGLAMATQSLVLQVRLLGWRQELERQRAMLLQAEELVVEDMRRAHTEGNMVSKGVQRDIAVLQSGGVLAGRLEESHTEVVRSQLAQLRLLDQLEALYLLPELPLSGLVVVEAVVADSLVEVRIEECIADRHLEAQRH